MKVFKINRPPVSMKVDEEEIGIQCLEKKLLKEGDGWDILESGHEIEGIVSC